AYYNTMVSIDQAKEAMVNKALIKWIVSSGIPFSSVNSPYFEDYTKLLNFGYNSPKRSALITSILDTEMANIILKMEKELSKAKNLTLCIDGWSSPLKHSIYTFIIMTNDRKQYIYSLQDFSRFSHTASFNAEKIIEILEKVRPKKFIAVVSDAESAMMAAKRQVAMKYPHILPIRCIAHHIQLISSTGAALRDEIIHSFTVGGNLKSTTKTQWSTAWDFCEFILRNKANIRLVLEQESQVFSCANAVKNLINNPDIFVELVKMAIAIQKTSALFNSQFRCDCIAIYNKRWKEFDTDLYLLVFFLHPTYRGEFFEASIYKNHVLKKALEIWKQIGGGRTSADFLKVQMSLYKNQESSFDNIFNSSIDTIYNWWLSVDLKKNEDHIKTLAIRICYCSSQCCM
ncbi:10489_t:CDS:2, partial [Ambispora gerdemannii]